LEKLNIAVLTTLVMNICDKSKTLSQFCHFILLKRRRLYASTPFV
jgi:hypothetical protein